MAFKPRYISAQEAEERIVALWRKERGAFADTFNAAIDACQTIVLDMYDNSSPNVVEVIRCADCRCFQANMRQDGYLPNGVPEYECRWWCGETDPTDYCSNAKREDGGQGE